MGRKMIAAVVISASLILGNFMFVLAGEERETAKTHVEKIQEAEKASELVFEENIKTENSVVAVRDSQGNEVFTASVNTTSARTGIQKALDYARDNASDSNIMTVKLSAGTYTVKSSMDIYSNTVLDLSSGAVIKRSGNSIIFYMGRCAADTSGYNGARNISIIGGVGKYGVLDGGGGSASMVRFAHAQNITIQNIYFTNVQKAHHMEFAAVKDVTIDACKFDGFAPANYVGRSNYEALQIDILLEEHFAGFSPYDGTGSSDVKITNNIFDGVSRGVGTHSAVTGKYMRNIQIANNTFTNNMGYAITAVNYIQSDISNNTIEGCGAGILYRHMIWDTGINYYNGNAADIATDLQTTICNNQITIKDTGFEGDRYGIYAFGEEVKNAKSWSESGSSSTIPVGDYRVKKVLITGNTIIISNVVNAVRFNGVCDSTLSGNKIYNFTNKKLNGYCDSVRLENSSSNTIKDNVIEDKSESASFIRNAIQIESGCNKNRIEKNKIVSTLNCGVNVENATGNVINENTIKSTAVAAIYINNGACQGSNSSTITKNTLENCGKYGIIGQQKTNMTVTENKIVKCSQTGIYFGQGSKGTVKDNKFTQCKGGYVCVQHGNSNILRVGNAKIGRITSQKKQLVLKWKKVKDAKKYVVYRSTSANGKYKKIATISKLTYTDKGVKKGKTYYYKIVPQTTVGKVAVYGGTSPVKSAKVKK